MQYIQVDEGGRLIAVADEGYHCGPGEMGVDIPAGFDKADMRAWVLEGGVLVRRPEEPEPVDAPTLEDKVAEVQATLASYEAAYREGVNEA